MEPIILLLIVLMIVAFVALVMEIPNCKDMRSLGLLIILIGLLFGGWPVVGIGAALVFGHYYLKKDKEDGV